MSVCGQFEAYRQIQSADDLISNHPNGIDLHPPLSKTDVDLSCHVIDGKSKTLVTGMQVVRNFPEAKCWLSSRHGFAEVLNDIARLHDHMLLQVSHLGYEHV